MRTLLTTLLLANLCLSPCLARNNSASRLSEQPQTLPELTPKPDQPPFELPPLEEDTTPIPPTTGVNMQLRGVAFKGKTVFTEAELQAIAAPFLNRTLDAGELETLRYQLSQHYVKHGYISSGAEIPDQTLQDGVLTIQLIEGQLTEINIDGNGWLHPDYLRYRLQEDGPFNAQRFQERYLLLLNDPLIAQLNGNLRPLPEPGNSALDLNVTRNTPYQLALHFNNYNPPSIGAEQLQAEAWVQNLTGWGDKFDFQFGISEGATIYSGGVSIPLHPSGTLFDFHFQTGRSAIVEEPLNNINITSQVTNYAWTLSQPVYRSVDQNLTLGASFASRQNQAGLLDNPCFAFPDAPCRNKTVSLRLFQEYSGRFEWQVLAARSTFSIGLDAFNATWLNDASKQDSDYFAWLGQLQYAWKALDNGAQLRFRGNLQLSNDPLLPQERISVGGVYSVRGYRQNELVRDNGFSSSLEFHYPLWNVQGTYANQLTVFPFMDYGAAWNHHDASEDLHAVGIGLSWQGFNHIKADLYYAHDIRKAAAKTSHDLQDDGVFFNVSVNAF